MKKQKIDKRAVKIAKDLLAKLKSRNILSCEYFDAYHKAICDFIFSYTGEDLRAKEFDALNEAIIKFQEVKK